MSWLLDTNACIRYLNARSPALKERIDAASESDIVVDEFARVSGLRWEDWEREAD